MKTNTFVLLTYIRLRQLLGGGRRRLTNILRRFKFGNEQQSNITSLTWNHVRFNKTRDGFSGFLQKPRPRRILKVYPQPRSTYYIGMLSLAPSTPLRLSDIGIKYMHIADTDTRTKYILQHSNSIYLYQ